MKRKEFIKTSFGALTLGFTTFTNLFSSSHTRTLGKTGVKVSAIGFGATRTKEPSLLHYAIDKGLSFIDTGRSYANGQNEVMIGKVIKGFRDKVVIQSKMRIRFRENEDLSSTATSKRMQRDMEKSLNDSLKALQTDYIDVLLLHDANKVDYIHHENVFEFFESAKKSGKIRACGFSSHINHVELLKANNASKFHDVVMIPYNHAGSYKHFPAGFYHEWDQPAAEEQMQIAEKNGIAIVAMKTCSAGPYSPDRKTAPSYSEALKWILRHSYICTMPAAMTNMDQIDENIKAFDY